MTRDSHLLNRRAATQICLTVTVKRSLAFAKKLMSERGTDMFTVTKMDKGADVVIESIYRYFSDSFTLIRTLLAEQNNEVSNALTEKFAPVKRAGICGDV
jgi:hypothetical protein